MLQVPAVELPASHPQLLRVIQETIDRSPQQRIPFAEFMSLALYHPQYGYYATNQQGVGIQQDFFTSPHLGSDFGELLATQLAELWVVLGCPRPFTLVEMGAGQGLLIQDILKYLHRHEFECFEALEYIVVETSPALLAQQQQRFQKLADSWGHLTWKTWDDMPLDSIEGCFFSNELVDAFPVHRVEIQQGQLHEVYVALDEARSLIDICASPSTSKLADYFSFIGINPFALPYPERYCTEINLAALDWLKQVSDRLHRGYILTIDYGYAAHRYYSPGRHQGTLQCYYQHRHHSDPYVAIGYQDMTAHVDFTALEKQGEQCGLQTLGWTQQAMFLMALGLGDRIAALSEMNPDEPLQTVLQRRQTLHSLIDPMGLGNFGVLLQAKGLTATEQRQPLKGFTIPAIASAG